MQYLLITPEIAVLLTALIILSIDLIIPRSHHKSKLAWVGILGLIISIIFVGYFFRQNKELFYGTYTVDSFAGFFKLIFIGAGILTIISAIDYIKPRIEVNEEGEFYSLTIFAVLGMMMMASSTDLITLYLSLELTSITCYVLTGYLRKEPRSSEAALKYFLFGAVCSAVMLFGMSLVYGLTGSTNIWGIAANLREALQIRALLVSSLMLILVGFGFKIALVPFHLWCPDAYEGAPTPITAFLSVAPKSAGFAILLRVLLAGFIGLKLDWVQLLAILAALTMTLGNLAAIPQTNIKRLLAYSSIAQAGYILIGLVAATGSSMGLPGVLIYLFIYFFMNLGAFIVVILFSYNTNSDLIEDYDGLITRAPLLAVSMAIFLLSLAGIPPLAGFVGKFYVFGAAIESGFLWLAIIGVVNVVFSIYYYIGIIRHMFLMDPKTSERLKEPAALKLGLILCLIATLLLGICPWGLIDLAQTSVSLLAHRLTVL